MSRKLRSVLLVISVGWMNLPFLHTGLLRRSLRRTLKKSGWEALILVPHLPTGRNVEVQAVSLREQVDSAWGLRPFDAMIFIGHSLGGLVVRRHLEGATLPDVPTLSLYAGTPFGGSWAGALVMGGARNDLRYGLPQARRYRLSGVKEILLAGRYDLLCRPKAVGALSAELPVVEVPVDHGGLIWARVAVEAICERVEEFLGTNESSPTQPDTSDTQGPPSPE